MEYVELYLMTVPVTLMHSYIIGARNDMNRNAGIETGNVYYVYVK